VVVVEAGETGVEDSVMICSSCDSSPDSEDSSDRGSESESENVAEMGLIGLDRGIESFGGLRDLADCWRWRLRVVSDSIPFACAGNDRRR
jgi:hypothetical protein